MKKESIIKRVVKCLELAGSSNPNEAANAMRKAQELMAAHNISSEEILAAQVTEKRVTSGRASRPPAWMGMLVNMVAGAFACEPISIQRFFAPGQIAFVGIDPAPELAGYVFTVLRRQITKDRAGFRKKCRGKEANRTRRADLFAAAWVSAAGSKVSAFANSGKTRERIEAYLTCHHPALVIHKPRPFNPTARDYSALAAGHGAGKNVCIHHGVNGAEQQRLTCVVKVER